MRFGWLLLSCVISHRGMSQSDVSFSMEGDSIWLKKIQLSSTVALHVNNAIVLMEEAPVLKKLREMRKAVKKQYQTELRKGTKIGNGVMVIPVVISHYEDRLRFLDTHIGQLEKKAPDTVILFQQLFESQGLSVSELVPPLLDAGKCMLMDSSLQLVPFVVRKSARKSNSLLVGSEPGMSYYFLPGATQYFLQNIELSGRRR